MMAEYKKAAEKFREAHVLEPNDDKIKGQEAAATLQNEANEYEQQAIKLEREASEFESSKGQDARAEMRRKNRDAGAKRREAAKKLLEALHLDPCNQTLQMEQDDETRRAHRDE